MYRRCNAKGWLEFYAGFLFSILSTCVYSGDTLRLDNHTDKYDLRAHIEWIENPAGNITLDDLIQKKYPGKFTHSRDEVPGLALTNMDYWLKFSVINDSSNREWILDQRYANTHYFDVYVVDEQNNILKEVHTGNLRPKSTRDILHRRLLFNITTGQGKRTTVFIHYKSESPIHIGMILWEKSRFIASDNRETMTFGVLYGWLTLFILVNILQLVIFRRPENFSSLMFISLCGGALSFYDGNAQLLFGSSVSHLAIYGLPVLMCCSIASLSHYWAIALLAQNNIVSSRICKILFYSWIGLAVAEFVLPYRVGIILMLALFFITTTYFIVVGLSGWMSRNHQSKLLLLAASSFYVFLILGTLYQMGHIQGPDFLEYGIQIGCALFMIFVAFSSVMHIRWMHNSHSESSEALASSETTFKAFLEQTTNLTVVLTPQGNVWKSNRSALVYEGFKLEEVVGKPLWEVSKFSLESENKIRTQNAIKAARMGNHTRFELNPISENEPIYQIDFWPFYDEHHEVSAILSEAQNITEFKNAKQKLDDIAFGVSEKIGDKFFEHLVKQLAKLIKVNYVCIGSVDIDNPENIHIIAQQANGKLKKHLTYETKFSPFGHIFEKKALFENDGIQSKYPAFDLFEDSNIESYLGIPLVNSRNKLIGVLALFDEEAIEDIEKINETLRIFITRAEAELERKISDAELEKAKQKLVIHTQNTPLALIELNNELKITNWNNSAFVTFGHSKESAIGKLAVDLLTDTSKINFDDSWLSMMSNRNGHFSRILNITSSGQEIVCDWYNTLLIDDDGEMIGVAALIVNVTAEYEAIKALRYKEQEQDEILDFMVDAVITIDEGGTIETFNQAAVSMFGFSQAEVIGQDVSILMPEEIGNQHGQFLRNYAVSEVANVIGISRELVAKRKDGSQFPIRLTVAELPLENSRRHFIATGLDLTAIKQQEEQLQRTQKMDALGKLTGGVAHDFNNLLGVIMGYGDLLGSLLDDQPKLARYSEEIIRACERGASMTKKLLAFSRQQLPNAKTWCINTILDDGRNVLERVLTPRIHIHYDLNMDLHLVYMDKNDFEDALLNLCINAMHAMDEKGDIDITTQNITLNEADANTLQLKAGEHAVLSIRDRGHGIDKQTLARIFDPFFSTKGEGGTGLGLSQVYGFVERSEGKIRVTSEPGEGTTFALYFPRDVDNKPPIAEPIFVPESDTRGDETILLVDDERALLTVTKETLSRNGYHVLTAESGKLALDILSQHSVDIMISDVIMPEMDGYQLASTVKENNADIKILLASGFTENRHLIKSNEAHNFPIIQKPYESSVLLRSVRNLVDSSKAPIA